MRCGGGGGSCLCFAQTHPRLWWGSLCRWLKVLNVREHTSAAELTCRVELKQLPRALQRCMYALAHSKASVFDTEDLCSACTELQVCLDCPAGRCHLASRKRHKSRYVDPVGGGIGWASVAAAIVGAWTTLLLACTGCLGSCVHGDPTTGCAVLCCAGVLLGCAGGRHPPPGTQGSHPLSHCAAPS